MKISQCAAIAVIAAVFATSALAATHTSAPLTPVRNTTTRSGYTIDTVGDTLGQARPQNTRLIIRVFGPDKKIVQPAQVALVDKSGAVINPVLREDRKVGHEENTGLPISVSPQAATSGISVGASVWISTRSWVRKEVTLTPRSIGRRRFSPAINNFRSRCQTDKRFCCP